MPKLSKLRSPGYQIAIAVGVVLTVGIGYVTFPPPDDPSGRILRVVLLAALGAIFGVLAHGLFSRMSGKE
jgi:hypothetical protein